MSTIYIPTSSSYEALLATDILSKNRYIWVHGKIEENMAIEVISSLLHFDKESNEEITMMIYSNGGNIQEGLAIYDVMKTIQSPVRTVAVGMAASMGAVLLAGGTKGRRLVMPSAKVMIHQPLVMGTGPVNVSEVIGMGEHMKGVKKMMNRILADCTGRTEEEVDKVCKQEKYLSAGEAVKFGLADLVVDGKSVCL